MYYRISIWTVHYRATERASNRHTDETDECEDIDERCFKNKFSNSAFYRIYFHHKRMLHNPCLQTCVWISLIETNEIHCEDNCEYPCSDSTKRTMHLNEY